MDGNQRPAAATVRSRYVTGKTIRAGAPRLHRRSGSTAKGRIASRRPKPIGARIGAPIAAKLAHFNSNEANITARDRAIAAAGSFLCVVSAVPFFLLVSSLLLDRYFVNTSSLSRGGAVAIIVSLTSALLFMFFYWTMTEFGPFHRHRLHPGWASPRIVLVAELNPCKSVLIWHRCLHAV